MANVSSLTVLIFIAVFGTPSCHSLTYTIPEQQNNHTLIANIGHDADIRSMVSESENENMRYIFLSLGSPHVLLFSLDERTSLLYTNGTMDREAIKFCEYLATCVIKLEVAAQSTSTSFFKKIEITIFLHDINDNEPSFRESSTQLSISEAVLVGTSFTIDGAVDKDSSNYSVKRYQVIPENSPFSAEYVKNLDGSSNVKLMVNEALDREDKDKYTIQVVAYDGGQPARTAVQTVEIRITDVNDNFPMFSISTYNVTVKEDVPLNTTILTVLATDLDIGVNGEIVYKLSPRQPEEIHNLFHVDSHTGQLSVIQPLVYTPGEVYPIIVEASDLGVPQPLTKQAFIMVKVKDSGNNPPKITLNLLQSANATEISEKSKNGFVVAHIAVVDPDTGRNGQVTCSLIGSHFNLQRLDVDEFKVTVSQPLDRETQDEHQITIFCHDMGSKRLNTTARFKVKLQDENDNKPLFSQAQYLTKEIMENNEVGAVIIQVSASDADLGDNGKVKYSLHMDAGSKFNIQPDTGVIYANKVFDRELEPVHKFHVIATDGGSPASSSSVIVIMKVGDLNDNAPVFNVTSLKHRTAENQEKETEVGMVEADDPDMDHNGVVTYSMAAEYLNEVPFKVLPNGMIETTERLDRESINKYTFTVLATDHGMHPLYTLAQVTISVTDENDNSPIIDFPEPTNNTFRVSYYMEPNTVITKIIANDIDAQGPNSQLSYLIQERNDSDLFNVNSKSGEVVLAREIGVEDLNHFTMTVIVADHGVKYRSTQTKLNFFVTMKNISSITPMPGEDENPQNLLITVTVLVVTAVLSGAIVITICIIRKGEKHKRKFIEAEKNWARTTDMEVSKVLSTDRVDMRPEGSGPVLPGISTYGTENSLENCGIVGQGKPQDPSQLSFISWADNQSRTHSPAPLSRDYMKQTYSRAQDSNRVASLWLQQNPLQSNGQASGNNTQHHTEDNHSNASGETNASDSGRGGSEMDINSSGPLSHSPDAHTDCFHQIHPHGGRRANPPHKRHHLSTFQPSQQCSILKNSKPETRRMPQHNSNHSLPQHKNVSFDSIPDFPFFGPQLYGRHTPVSIDCSNTVDSFATFDEDDNTTTSGSYTIDTEEYPSDARIHRLKDVYV
ncbi:hypothetical protein ScPMuIL_010469 [Solemya velum]